MRISGKYYVVAELAAYKVPDYDQSVKVQDGVIYVEGITKSNRKRWIEAGSLKNEKFAYEEELNRVIWMLDEIKEKAGISKTEIRRKLIENNIIGGK